MLSCEEPGHDDDRVFGRYGSLRAATDQAHVSGYADAAAMCRAAPKRRAGRAAHCEASLLVSEPSTPITIIAAFQAAGAGVTAAARRDDRVRIMYFRSSSAPHTMNGNGRSSGRSRAGGTAVPSSA